MLVQQNLNPIMGTDIFVLVFLFIYKSSFSEGFFFCTLVKQETKTCFSCMAEELYLIVLREKVNISCFLSKKCHENLNS
jgi:hypothetical protein